MQAVRAVYSVHAVHCLQSVHAVTYVHTVHCMHGLQPNPNTNAYPKHKPLTLTMQVVRAAYCVNAGPCVQAVHFQQQCMQ